MNFIIPYLDYEVLIGLRWRWLLTAFQSQCTNSIVHIQKQAVAVHTADAGTISGCSRAEQNSIVTLLCRSYIARSDYVLLTTTTGTLGNDVPGTPVRGKLRQEKLVCLVSSSGSHEAKKYPPQILSYLC